ncbi:MAG: hypothetical protein ACI35O_06025 [Bacillaceae bacterium]
MTEGCMMWSDTICHFMSRLFIEELKGMEYEEMMARLQKYRVIDMSVYV